MVHPAHRTEVLRRYKELIALIRRLPGGKQASALDEARSLTKQRKTEANSEQSFLHLKELVAKIGYLRVITPKMSTDATKATGHYVLRDGKLVEGVGMEKGSRVADGVVSYDEAMRQNNKHFKKFYGADKPNNMFF